MTPVIATCQTTGQTYHYKSITEAAIKGGFERSCVVSCVHGKQKAHGGYTFKAPSKPSWQPSPRLVQVAEMRNAGLSNIQIAAQIGITANSVKAKACQARALGMIE